MRTGNKLRVLLNWVGRIALLVLGSFVMTFGISAVASSDLGNTPISALPYTAAALSGLTFGTTTFIVNMCFLALQILILRKKFRLYNLLQVPAVFVFGCFIDISMGILSSLEMPAWPYAGKVAASVAGSFILACGIALSIQSRTILQPGEAMVLSVHEVTGVPFSTLKIFNDVTLVCLACVLGWAASGEIIGVREGTVFSAVLVGLFLKALSWAARRASLMREK